MLMFKNSKQMIPIAAAATVRTCMLFARNDQHHNYNTRQSRALHPSVGRDEAIYRTVFLISLCEYMYMELSIKTYSN